MCLFAHCLECLTECHQSFQISRRFLMPNQQKKHRGFAAMDHEKQREIASKGGKAAHEKGTAHEFTPEEAREAGRKGGLRSHGERTNANGARQEGNGSAGMN